MDLGSRKRTTLSQGRKPSVSGVCSPFQKRHFGAGKDGKHLRTVPLQLDRMSPHEICKLQPSSYTQLDLREGSWVSGLPPEHS